MQITFCKDTCPQNTSTSAWGQVARLIPEVIHIYQSIKSKPARDIFLPWYSIINVLGRTIKKKEKEITIGDHICTHIK